MPRLKHAVPSYRKHKRSGQAVVTLDGRGFYLGPHGTAVSRREYDRLVGEWQANGRRLPASAGGAGDLTVNELALAYLKWADGYYRAPDGEHTSEIKCVRLALRHLKERYGRTMTRDFGPLALKTVRQAMIDADWTRTSINKHVSRVKMIFKWAVAEELVPPSVYHGLQAVTGLKAGRSKAREGKKVKPVPIEYVDAIKPYVSGQVWAVVQLQLLTGARGGELLKMRPCDLDTTGELWVYALAAHKTRHFGHERLILLGPRAQIIVRPFLAGRTTDVFIFSAAEAEAERRTARHSARKTPLSCGNRPGTNRKRKPKRQPADWYTPASYRRAITRACKLAGVPEWHPHQLRHTTATDIRKRFGVEAARVVLGHRSPAVTELYAEIDRGKAEHVIAAVG